MFALYYACFAYDHAQSRCAIMEQWMHLVEARYASPNPASLRDLDLEVPVWHEATIESGDARLDMLETYKFTKESPPFRDTDTLAEKMYRFSAQLKVRWFNYLLHTQQLDPEFVAEFMWLADVSDSDDDSPGECT